MRTILFLAALLFASPLAAQTQRIVETPSPTITTTLQNAATANGNGTVLTISGYSMFTLVANCASCSGGTTINFEASMDGTNYDVHPGYGVGGSVSATTTWTSGAIRLEFPTRGMQFFRARISGYSAGTVTVTSFISMTQTTHVLVDVSALPSGAATATKQDDVTTAVGISNTYLDAIVTVLGSTSTAANQTTEITALQIIDNLPNTLGSTTSGQSGALALGAVTTAAPSYTNAQSNALSLTTAGLLRTDGSGVTQPVSGTVTVGTFPDNEPINVAQMNGVAVTMGNGASGTGVQRVTIANDSTGTVAATQSGTWNVNNISGTVSLPTGAATSANQSTAITALQLIDDPVQVLGTDTYTEATSKGMTLGAVRRDADTTLVNTTNEFGPLQMDANGRLKVEVFSGETLPVSGTVTTTPPSNASTNVAQFGGTNVSTGTGAGGAGIPRVTLSNDSSLAANQSVNVAQINGVTPLMGTGNTGTGSHRVTIATDQAALAGMGVGATGAAPPANANYIGGIGSGATGGFTQPVTSCDSQAFLDMSTATTTELVALTASRKIYVCYWLINSDGAATVTFKRGTGSNCGTGTTSISPAWRIAANAGFSGGSGLGAIFDNQNAGDALCVTSSAAVNLQIFVRYAKY